MLDGGDDNEEEEDDEALAAALTPVALDVRRFCCRLASRACVAVALVIALRAAAVAAAAAITDCGLVLGTTTPVTKFKITRRRRGRSDNSEDALLPNAIKTRQRCMRALGLR